MLFGTATIVYKVTRMVATFRRRKVKIQELIIYYINHAYVSETLRAKLMCRMMEFNLSLKSQPLWIHYSNEFCLHISPLCQRMTGIDRIALLSRCSSHSSGFVSVCMRVHSVRCQPTDFVVAVVVVVFRRSLAISDRARHLEYYAILMWKSQLPGGIISAFARWSLCTYINELQQWKYI